MHAVIAVAVSQDDLLQMGDYTFHIRLLIRGGTKSAPAVLRSDEQPPVNVAVTLEYIYRKTCNNAFDPRFSCDLGIANIEGVTPSHCLCRLERFPCVIARNEWCRECSDPDG